MGAVSTGYRLRRAPSCSPTFSVFAGPEAMQAATRAALRILSGSRSSLYA